MTLRLQRPDARDLADLVAEALSFFGPRTPAQLHAWAPFDALRIDAALQQLNSAGRIVVGPLRTDDPNPRWCDLPGLEALLRLQRARRRATIAPLAMTLLPAFLARWQGFGGDIDNALQRLSGYRTPAALLEGELLPARVPGYAPHQFDDALRDGHCHWYGTGNAELAICDPAHLELLLPPPTGPEITFPDARARYDFFTLADVHATPVATFSAALWAAAWGGRVTTDDFASVRAGIARDFALPEPGSTPGGAAQTTGYSPIARGQRHSARQRAQGWPGTWRSLTAAVAAAEPAMTRSGDAVSRLERDKSLVRLLLNRYGVLCRDLIAREQPPFSWQVLFRALRLMELGGEVIAGHFFAGLSAPQFAAPAALSILERAAAGGGAATLFWCSAIDPISPCGLTDRSANSDPPGDSTARWSLDLPRRVAGNHLAFRGRELICVSEARGRRLQITPGPDDPDIDGCFAPLLHLLRPDGGRHRLEVEIINGRPATSSAYLPALRRLFDVLIDHRLVTLRRRFA